MKFVFDTLNIIRANTWKAVEGYSEEQLNLIPQGMNNNIAWNLGHMITSQQLLCYKNGGAEILIPESFLPLFRKDTSPKDWTKPADLKEIKHYFELTSEAFSKDYDKKIFNGYKEYKTSAGATLSKTEDAIIYNYGHENLHYGTILALRKLVK
jgi:hypothetical protein